MATYLSRRGKEHKVGEASTSCVCLSHTPPISPDDKAPVRQDLSGACLSTQENGAGGTNLTSACAHTSTSRGLTEADGWLRITGTQCLQCIEGAQ